MFRASVDDVRKQQDYRRVLWTGTHTQIVLMTLQAGEEIGSEVHEDTDQIFAFLDGTGEVEIDGETATVGAGDLVAVPAGARHNVRNTGAGALALYTVYGPPEHPPGTVHTTRPAGG